MAKTAEPDGHEKRYALLGGRRPVFEPGGSGPSAPSPEFPAVVRARKRDADLAEWLKDTAEILDGSS